MEKNPVYKKIRVSVPKLGETIREVRYEEDEDTLTFIIETESAASDVRIVRGKETSEPFAQLLGRALARTRVDPQTNSSWSFLGAHDLEKTSFREPSKEFMWRIVEAVRLVAPEKATTLLLWQKDGTIFTLGKTARAETIKRSAPDGIRFLQKFGPEAFETGPWDNFYDAEAHLKRILKQTSEPAI
jgi:hypothetical protein